MRIEKLAGIDEAGGDHGAAMDEQLLGVDRGVWTGAIGRLGPGKPVIGRSINTDTFQRHADTDEEITAIAGDGLHPGVDG